MSLRRARVIKGAFPPAGVQKDSMELARRVPQAVVDGRQEAARIIANAEAKAAELIASARASVFEIERDAATSARERELGRVAAELLVVRSAEEQRLARDVDRTIELAALLAERLIGEGLALEPSRVRTLAQAVLTETRGARTVRIEAHPDDLREVHEVFANAVASGVDVTPSNELARGSLVVQTELGRVDARLRPQLLHLGEALRDIVAKAQPKT